MPAKKYGVVYCDVPWAYHNFADAAHGAAVNHYDTMDLAGLCALGKFVRGRAAKDCLLAFWATWPKLDEAFKILEAWGFEYVTGTPWLKVVPSSGTIRTGTGFWWQSASEILLIARRGKPKTRRIPLLALLAGPNRDFYGKDGQPIYCDRIKGHSAKPLSIRRWLRAKLPGPYLEMFATSRTPGWTCLGRALGHEIMPGGVRPYRPKGALRTVRGRARARSTYHEPRAAHRLPESPKRVLPDATLGLGVF